MSYQQPIVIPTTTVNLAGNFWKKFIEDERQYMYTFVYDPSPTLQIIKIEDDQEKGWFASPGNIHVTLADEKYHHRCFLSPRLRSRFESEDFLSSNVHGSQFVNQYGIIDLKRAKVIKEPGIKPIVTVLDYEVVCYSETLLAKTKEL
jgi:hypothetical protein